MAIKHKDLTGIELHDPKGFSDASINQGLIKNGDGDLEWVPVAELGGAEGPPGSLQSISVADIDDPSTELNAANLATYGRFIYVYQAQSSNDALTFYRYDSSNSDAVDPPYVISTLDGGSTRWIAVGGKHITTGTTAQDSSRFISSTEVSKLSGITAGANVTDETSVVASLDGATLTSVTVASTDKVIVQDDSDSDNIKTVTAQDIADLSAGTTEFTGLTDTPVNYTSQSLKAVRVNVGETALEFYTPGTRDINSQTGTTYTTVLGDSSKLINCENASAITVTIPTNASVAYPVGTEIDFTQLGTGSVTFSSSATIRSLFDSVKMAGIYSRVTITKIDTDEWILSGGLA